MKNQKGIALSRDLLKKCKILRFWLERHCAPIKRWHQLAADRRKLASLSDAALGELGLIRADVQHDGESPSPGDPRVKLPRHFKRNY